MLRFPIRTPVNATSICCGLLVAAPFTAAIAETAMARKRYRTIAKRAITLLFFLIVARKRRRTVNFVNCKF